MASVEEKDLKEQPIEELKIYPGTIKLLKQNNIHNLQQLFQKTEEDFMKMKQTSERGRFVAKRSMRRKELHILLCEIEAYKKKMAVASV